VDGNGGWWQQCGMVMCACMDVWLHVGEGLGFGGGGLSTHGPRRRPGVAAGGGPGFAAPANCAHVRVKGPWYSHAHMHTKGASDTRGRQDVGGVV